MPAAGFKMIRLTPAGIARRAAARRAKLDALAAEAYAYYQTGKSLSETGAHFGGRKNTSIRSLFETRGYALRKDWRSERAHLGNGCFAAKESLGAAEVDAIVATVTDLRVPPALIFTWRKWNLAERADYLRRVRARLGPQSHRPTGPYSANVEFFDYGSERAHAIVDRLNIGRNSQTKAACLKTNSEGVIFEGALWFWSHKIGYARGPVRQGLQLLHHFIWTRAHGRPVPAGCVLRFADGNQNNLLPENLTLATRNDVARENQAKALTEKSRLFTTALLERSQNQQAHETITHLRHSAVQR